MKAIYFDRSFDYEELLINVKTNYGENIKSKFKKKHFYKANIIIIIVIIIIQYPSLTYF